MIRRNAILIITLATALLAADSVVVAARKLIAAKKYDDAIAQLEPAYKSKPTPEVQKALADANLGKADALMADDAAPPRVKYPGALKAYREVLKYDKNNQPAQQAIATIEGIYKSMGRPIPQ